MLEETEVNTAWIKVPEDSELTFVGQDAVCFGRGCCLLFLNLLNNEEKIYSAHNYENGDGIECYVGHRLLPMLAFAEKVLNPRIFVLSYPNFEKIIILEGGAPAGYMTMVFSNFYHLITLSSLPEYEIVVWHWKTGEKLFAANSEQRYPNQILSCSHTKPILVIQYSENSKEFLKWTFLNSYSNCAGIRTTVKLPVVDKVVSCIWGLDNVAFILDKKGCIFKVTPNDKLEIIIYGTISLSREKPCFQWFKNGILYMSKCDFQIRHYNEKNNWWDDWSVTPIKMKQFLSCTGKDILLGWTYKAELMELNLNKYCFTLRKKYETPSEVFSLIYPSCSHFVSLRSDTTSKICIYDCLLGNEITVIKMKENITTLSSNPVYPYIAAGFSNGLLSLINCYDPASPSILTKFYLYEHEITIITFTDNGDIILTGNLIRGLFFVIQGKPGEHMKILHYINYRRTTLDVCIDDDEKYINVYILIPSEKHLGVSNKIVVKSISKLTNRIKKKHYTNDKHSFINLNTNKNGFLKKKIKILNEMHTGHQFKHFILGHNPMYMYTYGFDGLIIVRDQNFENILAAILPHHRYNGGVKNILVDPYLRFIISYGTKTKELICSVISQDEEAKDKEIKKKINLDMVNLKDRFVESTTTGFDPKDDAPYKTYLEFLDFKKKKYETEKFAFERKNIIEEFNIMKHELQRLLHQNIIGPHLEKIDVIEFYQFTLYRQHKEELTKKECEWTVQYYNQLIQSQNQVWNFIKKKFYDSMDIIGTSICGIFKKFDVEGYTIEHNASKIIPIAWMADTYRQFECFLRESDIFLPWQPQREDIIQEILQKIPIITLTSESIRMQQMLDSDDGSSMDVLRYKRATTSPYPSNTLSDFLQFSPLLYNQEEIHTFCQYRFQMRLIQQDEYNIRKLFNCHYEKMKEQKEREMKNILEKINRLRFILNEMNFYNIQVLEPEWNPIEYMKNTLTVLPSEMSITPYISPSQQARLDAEAAEAERIRLLLLADDFRERALIKMMDGVLEVRWEDTLKRDIPKPKCMLDKEPENFNEDDLRAVRDYEEKVAILNSDRLIYRNMLENEYQKVSEQVREAIKKYNSKLEELNLFKMRAETARLQQVFSVHRTQYETIQRIVEDEKLEALIKQVVQIEEKIIIIQNTYADFQKATVEFKTDIETIIAKDKLIEKNFKKDFQDYSPLIQEQSYKLYKKQPKVILKGLNSLLLLELSNCCKNHTSSLLLIGNWLEYLHSVDALDHFIGVPESIDESTYKIICKHRRLRLSNDLEMKSILVRQSDTEKSVQFYQKYLASVIELCATLKNNISVKREMKLIYSQNKQIQLVMKRGYVEVPTIGLVKDFDNSILIHRKYVEDVNARILKAGEHKIQVIKNKMIHRRDILKKEWEHKVLKMNIEDLKERLHLISQFHVTKDVYQYLRQRAKGESFEQTSLTLDQEIELKKKMYNRIINEREKGIKELNKQIKTYKKKNKVLDQQISTFNLNMWEIKFEFDSDFDKYNKHLNKKILNSVKKRNELIKQIQENHNEIAALQAELELVRMKNHPSLTFDVLT